MCPFVSQSRTRAYGGRRPNKVQFLVMTSEDQRLKDAKGARSFWMLWGPYLSERQLGTVREDYSAGGEAWNYLTHDEARSRAYRWGEDGLAGICDPDQALCFALALWNGSDPILKERLFGLGTRSTQNYSAIAGFATTSISTNTLTATPGGA